MLMFPLAAAMLQLSTSIPTANLHSFADKTKSVGKITEIRSKQQCEKN